MKRTLCNFLFLSFISFVLISFSCHKDVTQDNVKPDISFKKIALEKYKTNISYLYSPDSNYVACYRKETMDESNGDPQLKFFIYDISGKKIVFEDNLRSEKLLWLDSDKLEVKKRPEMITKDSKTNAEMMGYIYDIKQNKKLPLQNVTDDDSIKLK